MKVNEAGPLAELTALYGAYEAALMADDVAALAGFFWEHDLVRRYALGVNSYGHQSITAARQARRAEDRTLEATLITTYGDDLGTADTEFTRTATGRRGRQTQTWVRFDEGWRIVSAHVSWLDEPAWPTNEGGAQ